MAEFDREKVRGIVEEFVGNMDPSERRMVGLETPDGKLTDDLKLGFGAVIQLTNHYCSAASRKPTSFGEVVPKTMGEWLDMIEMATAPE